MSALGPGAAYSPKTRELLTAVDNDLQQLDDLRVSGAPAALKDLLAAARSAAREAFETARIYGEEDALYAGENARFRIAAAIYMARSLGLLAGVPAVRSRRAPDHQGTGVTSSPG